MDNMSNSEKIQVVINTLKDFDIKPTYQNCSLMVGVCNLLAEVRDAIHEQELKAEENHAEVKENAGETDTE